MKLKVWGLCLGGVARFIVAAPSKKRAAIVFARVGITPQQVKTLAHLSEDVREIARARRSPETVLSRSIHATADEPWTVLG